MGDTDALVKQESKPTAFAGFPIEQMAQIKEFGQILLKSGLMPPAVNTVEKAIILVMKGHDLGLTYMQSIESINVIQGKPAISASLIQAKIRRSGMCEYLTVEEMTDKNCRIVTKRKDEKKPFTYEFGEKEAKEQGLLSKDNYKKQPKNMYFSRCMSAIGRYCYADVFFGGIYVPEELGVEETQQSKGLTNTQENADFVVEPDKTTPPNATIAPKPVSPRGKKKAKELELSKAKEITFDTKGNLEPVEEAVFEVATEQKDDDLPLPQLTEEELEELRKDAETANAGTAIDEPIDEPAYDPNSFEIDIKTISWLKENPITSAINSYKEENRQYGEDEPTSQDQTDFLKLFCNTIFLANEEKADIQNFKTESGKALKEYIDSYIALRNERYQMAKAEWQKWKGLVK